MEQLNFSKTELLENITVNGKYVTLINSAVEILLIIDSPSEITLFGYKKKPEELRKGVARCALYYLLTELLRSSIITNEQVIRVSSPTPDDGDLPRLIKIYEQIGFILGEPQPGNPDNLNATVETIISTLKDQCNSDTVGGHKEKKSKTNKRRSRSVFALKRRIHKKTRRQKRFAFKKN